MAQAKKRSRKSIRRAIVAGTVTIDLPRDGTNNVSSSFDASGGATGGGDVTGILTNADTGATTQSDPASAAVTGGNWTLSFHNVPAGTYILAVNQLDPNDGADAVNITIPPVTALTIGTVTFPGGVTTVAGTCAGTDTVSAVVVSSRPKHGTPKKHKGSTSTNFTFKFPGLASGPHTVTVYPVRGRSRGAKKTFNVP